MIVEGSSLFQGSQTAMDPLKAGAAAAPGPDVYSTPDPTDRCFRLKSNFLLAGTNSTLKIRKGEGRKAERITRKGSKNIW